MDLTESLAAKSDQLNAVDVPTPRTFTIEKITENRGNPQQPFNFHLVETPGRPWRPNKGMRRVVAKAWGEKDIGTRYPGRRVTLWCNPEVVYAGVAVGGLQVSHLSDIDEPFTMPLRVSQKKVQQFTVQPLTDTHAPAAVPTVERVQSVTDVNELRDMWTHAGPDVQQAIKQRVAELQETP